MSVASSLLFEIMAVVFSHRAMFRSRSLLGGSGSEICFPSRGYLYIYLKNKMAELYLNLCVCVFSIIFQTFHGQFQKFKLYEYRYVLWPGMGPK